MDLAGTLSRLGRGAREEDQRQEAGGEVQRIAHGFVGAGHMLLAVG